MDMALHIKSHALAAAIGLALTAVTPAAAQTSLEEGRGMVWASAGFQADTGGSVNSSGIGVVGGARAEIDTNTWGERYDAALIFRFGGAYNINDRSQAFAAIYWEQSEADSTTVGLIGGQPLEGDFSDYQGWGLDFGYRYFFPQSTGPLPFVSASLGIQKVDAIDLTLSSITGFAAGNVPFYDESWVSSWRIGTGFLWDINERFGVQVTLDLKYAGVLSDVAGIGTVGFERINDTGNRWTLPFSGGVYLKF
jgi:hypothetical protein